MGFALVVPFGLGDGEGLLFELALAVGEAEGLAFELFLALGDGDALAFGASFSAAAFVADSFTHC